MSNFRPAFLAAFLQTLPYMVCWSLLYIYIYIAILHSQADSLCSHVILHEWLAFYGVCLNIHWSAVLTALAWLVHGMFCIHHTTIKPHTKGTYMFSCNLPPAPLAEWPGYFMCYCSNTGVEWILKWASTENWPWRRKFSCRSCWDLNPQPFSHESGALTTELSPLPMLVTLLKRHYLILPAHLSSPNTPKSLAVSTS